MDIEKIEQYVEDLLTVSGFCKEGEEHHLWVLLRHLYAAIAMYEQMSEDEKTIIKATQKKLRYFFETNCNLKESGRRKKEKQENTPTPLKEKIENKDETAKKTSVSASREAWILDERQKAFWKELSQYIGKPYDLQLVQSFFYYWAEKEKKSGKMLWETRRSWNLRMRLASWSKRSYCIDDRIAQIKLQKVEKRNEADTASKHYQQSVTAIREQDNERREREQEESKQNQELTDDYLKRNPNGLLARFARERKQKEKIIKHRDTETQRL